MFFIRQGMKLAGLITLLGLSTGVVVAQEERPSSPLKQLQSQVAVGKYLKLPTFKLLGQGLKKAEWQRYNQARDFKALARDKSGFAGFAVNKFTLIDAEREALEDCLSRSNYQADCRIVQVGAFALPEKSQERTKVRRNYLWQIHGLLAKTEPLRYFYQVKGRQPGSRIIDARLLFSRPQGQDSFAYLQTTDDACSGTARDLNEGKAEQENTADPKNKAKTKKTLSILEMSCRTYGRLFGGILTLSPTEALVFLENDRGERWEFLQSPKQQSIGYDLYRFSKSFKALEEAADQ